MIGFPARVKLLLWRACRGCLPTSMALQRKGITCSPHCVLCDSQIETWHSFITCPHSIDCWVRLNLWNDIDKLLLGADGFKYICFMLLTAWDDKNRSNFAMGIWSIWCKRNDKLWEGTNTTASLVVSQANTYLSDWLAAKSITAQSDSPQAGPSTATTWTPPPAEYIKCNVDASFSASNHMTGFGICCHDASGGFIAAKLDSFALCLHVSKGEALALLRATQWVQSLGFQNVIFEVDSQVVTHSFGSTQPDNSDFSSIIKAYSRLFSYFSNSSVSSVRRQTNSVAHALAKAALSIATP